MRNHEPPAVRGERSSWGLHTLRGGVLAAEVLLLVASQKTLGLNLGSRATGELLVKVHDLLHANGIGRRADGLFP